MIKQKVIFLVVLTFIISAFYLFLGQKEDYKKAQQVPSLAYKYSREYLSLRYRTDLTLTYANKFSSYEAWNREMDDLVTAWKQMENDARDLGEEAKGYGKEASFRHSGNIAYFKFFSPVSAYSQQEISDVFDKAPAGKKIHTLAKFLGVDAKRAYKILQNDQEQVKADAWNKAGDTFKTLETSAVVIKDSCKVAGFVGSVIISGGTAGFTAAGSLTQVSVVVTGVDMALEIGDDGATIALGDKNKVSSFFGSMRIVTEPAAAILGLTDMVGNAAVNIGKAGLNFDDFNMVMFGTDQLRSNIQDGKVLGISVSGNGKTMATTLKKSEVKDWLKGQGKSDSPSNANDLLDDELKQIVKEFINNENKKNEFAKEKEKTENSFKEETGNKAESSKRDDEYGEHKVYAQNGITNVAITGPKESSFASDQTRLWQADVKDYDSNEQGQPVCYWKFYLNGKEVWHQDKTCKFTASVAQEGGILRAEVTVKFSKTHYELVEHPAPGELVQETKKVVEVLETVTAKRNYKVLPPPVDTYIYGQ